LYGYAGFDNEDGTDVLRDENGSMITRNEAYGTESYEDTEELVRQVSMAIAKGEAGTNADQWTTYFQDSMGMIEPAAAELAEYLSYNSEAVYDSGKMYN
jgi:hypothetical protein